MTTAICTVGYPGAGKTAAQTPAKERNIPVVVMGDRVRERAVAAIDDERLQQAEQSDSDVSKSDLIGKWATEQREEHGDTVVAQWTVDYVEEHIDDDWVFVDGMRSLAERSIFEEAFDNVVVVYIEASSETRLERLQERGRDGEETFTKEQLQERDAREDEWGVSSVVDDADVTIPNESGIDTFHDAVGSFLDSLVEENNN